MVAEIVLKDPEYIYNHCTKSLARIDPTPRHSYFNLDDGNPRALISEPWRFPIIDEHDGDEADRYDWNDVTFVYVAPLEGSKPTKVEVATTAHELCDPIEMKQVEDSIYWTTTLRVRKGEKHRYRLIVDGRSMLDPINPQEETLITGETWSRFFTSACTEPLVFERWELAILDRLTREVLPINNAEARNYLNREGASPVVQHLHRLDVPVGVANYIDKITAREERHQRYAYKTCLDMIDRILRKRTGGKDPEFVPEAEYTRLYDEMAANNQALIADGWDLARYGNPSNFLYLLRRHAWTGAFSHPKYGGNPSGVGWHFLESRFETTDDNPPRTAFDWAKAIERPLGTSTEYYG